LINTYITNNNTKEGDGYMINVKQGAPTISADKIEEVHAVFAELQNYTQTAKRLDLNVNTVRKYVKAGK